MLSIFLSEELEHLAEQSHSTIFMEYFCDNKDDRRNSATAILRGLIYQILKSRSNLFKHIIPDFEIQGEELFARSSFPSLWRIFRDMLQDPHLGTVYCVLDGLDECDRDSLELLLLKLRSVFVTESGPHKVCRLKMIIVSRDLSDFLPEVLSSFPRITLDPDTDVNINHDIHRFIENKVNELSKLRRYPDQLCAHVKDVFKNRAQGTFLWIGIAAQELRQYIATEVEGALKSFPRGLEPLFARMLLQIDPGRRQVVSRILRWVVVAARPLTVSELSIAIMPHGDFHAVAFSREEVMRDQILSCGYLLSITNDTVDIVHQSVKDYLLRKNSDSNAELEAFRIKGDEGNLEIARRCFYYLQDVALSKEKPVEDPQRFKMSSERRHGLPKEFPLLSYAMQYWPTHASALSHTDDIFDVSLPFYRDPKFCAIWRKIYYTLDDTEGQRIPFNLLHIASYFNLKMLAENIISTHRFKESSDGKSQLNEPDERGLTALLLAAERGSVAMSQLLLNEEAQIDARDDSKRTALHVAVKGGHLTVVRLLLDRGAFIEARDNKGETPLHFAARSEHIAVVQLLLDKGASTEARDKSEETPLHFAARGRHIAVLQLLLDNGASTEARDYKGETALHTAVCRGPVTTARHLLIRGASYGNAEVVQILLNRGAFIEATNKSGETALHIASCSDDAKTVGFLLVEGASTEATNHDGETALHFAVEYGDVEVVQLLLEKRAFIEAENKHGMRPLHIAAGGGRLKIVRLLLRNGADITVKNKKESTPLHFAARSGNEDLVQLMLDWEAYKEAKDKFRKTPLHDAARKGHSTVVQTLLVNEANANSRDCDGWTALHYAAQYKAKAAAELLLNNGADLEIECKQGETALHKAARLGSLSIVEMLLDKGASINAQDKSKCTAVHHAAKEGRTVTLRHLLERGASTEITNCDGLTALQVALQVAEWDNGRNQMIVARLLQEYQSNVNANEQDEEEEEDSAPDEATSLPSDEAESSESDDAA